MRIYLSLPITGYDIEERKDYANRQVDVLEGIYPDSEVYNPLSLVDGYDYSYARYMGLDMAELADSDMIVFCPDFNKSQGCMTEFWFACRKNMPIQFIDDDGRVWHDDAYILSVPDESEKKGPWSFEFVENATLEDGTHAAVANKNGMVRARLKGTNEAQPTEERWIPKTQKELEEIRNWVKVHHVESDADDRPSDDEAAKFKWYLDKGYFPCQPIKTTRGTFTCTNDIQNCINVYEERIEELTEQCNKLFKEKKEGEDAINKKNSFICNQKRQIIGMQEYIDFLFKQNEDFKKGKFKKHDNDITEVEINLINYVRRLHCMDHFAFFNHGGYTYRMLDNDEILNDMAKDLACTNLTGKELLEQLNKRYNS